MLWKDDQARDAEARHGAKGSIPKGMVYASPAEEYRRELAQRKAA